MENQALPRVIRTMARRLGPKPLIGWYGLGGTGTLSWVDVDRLIRGIAIKLLRGGLIKDEIVLVTPSAPCSLVFEIAVHAAGGIAAILPSSSLVTPFNVPRDVHARLVLSGPDRRPILVDDERFEVRIEECRLETEVPDSPALSDENDPIDLSERMAGIGPVSICTAFVSESAGQSVALKQRNLTRTAELVAQYIGAPPAPKILAIGDTSDVSVRVASWYMALVTGGMVVIGDSEEISSAGTWVFKPDMVMGRPESLMQFVDDVQHQLDELAGITGKIVRRSLARQTSRIMNREPENSGLLAVVDGSLVRSRALPVVGGRLKTVLACGGVPDAQTMAFLRGLGVQVFGSHGYPQTTGFATIANPDDIADQTLGMPIESCSIEPEKNDRFRILGPNVMFSYLGISPKANPDIEDGAFIVFDGGRLDERGRLVRKQGPWDETE